MPLNEKIKSYFDRELMSTLVYAVVAIIAGYLSFLLNKPTIAFVVMIAILAITTLFIRVVLRIKEKYSWYMGNGIAIFLFIWFVVWTVLYNLNITV